MHLQLLLQSCYLRLPRQERQELVYEAIGVHISQPITW
jgi:hypothetical protein